MRLVLIAFLFILAPVAAQAACGHDQFRVEGAPDEIQMTCDALVAVSGYFTGLGESEIPAVLVRFADSVAFPGAANLSVAGVFRGEDGTIDVVRPSSTHSGRALHWGQPWSTAVAQSVLEHELTHAFAYPIGGNRLDYVWNEFLAYAVQFAVMEPALRSKILAAFPGATAYDDLKAVCDLGYLEDVDLFAVRAYLTVEGRGGESFIKRLLAGELTPRPARRFECPML